MSCNDFRRGAMQCGTTVCKSMNVFRMEIPSQRVLEEFKHEGWQSSTSVHYGVYLANVTNPLRDPIRLQTPSLQPSRKHLPTPLYSCSNHPHPHPHLLAFPSTLDNRFGTIELEFAVLSLSDPLSKSCQSHGA